MARLIALTLSIAAGLCTPFTDANAQGEFETTGTTVPNTSGTPLVINKKQAR